MGGPLTVEQEVGGSSPPNCTTPSSQQDQALTPPAWAVTRCPPLLANVRWFTHYSRQSMRPGGLMAIFRIRNVHVGLMLATAFAVSICPTMSQAYTPGLHQRCLPALQLRNSRCGARHRLHGRQEVAALAALPGAVQARSGARSGRDRAGRQADGDQADCPTQICQCQAQT
jgi:hypothetical protein